MIQKLVNYIDNLNGIGITVDYTYLEDLYLNVNEDIRSKASILLLPVATSSGIVYGMDRHGGLVPFTFSRATGATLFDKDLNLQVVSADIPRIDYGNYSQSTKILIEKESTNLNTYSGNYTDGNGVFAGIFSPDRNRVSLINDEKFNKVISVNNDATHVRMLNIALNIANTYIFSVFINTPSKYNDAITAFSRFLHTPSKPIDKNFNFPLNQWSKIEHSTSATDLPSETHHIYSNRDLVSPYKIACWQIEQGNTATSFIPTTASQVTRSADQLVYNLPRACSVYLRTTKQNVVLNKPAGPWNISEDLDNEGIEVLAIMLGESINTALLSTGELIESEGGRVTGALVTTGELIESEGGRVTGVVVNRENVLDVDVMFI